MAKFTLSILSLLLLSFQINAQWVDFTDASSTWLSTGNDGLEKDIAIGDLDQNGYDDIVVVRKNPFSNPGAGTDLLLLNDGTQLTDGTATYAPGFNSNPSDSRDVVIEDFTGDGWLDVVIANTFEDQPVFYKNMGESNGVWQGLVDETAARFPVPVNISPLQICAVWAGDLTGNGALDLYFSNYGQNSGQGGVDDLLLINDGNGVFTDETVARLGNLRKSAFGTSCEIHDMDGDGDNDIVKISTLYNIPPFNDEGVFILFNDGNGNFSNWQKIPSNEPYMFTVGQLDGNDLPDVYVVDDFQDYFRFAQSANPNNSVSYSNFTSTNPRTTGFGGNCKLGDLDGDGDLDLGVANVDVDIPPCQIGGLRQFTLGRNDGGGSFSAPYGSTNLPWTVSAFDFAFIDLDGDCDLDIFLGKCNDYAVFLNQSNTGNVNVSISGNANICDGESTELNAGSNYASYSWSNGNMGQFNTVSATGTYCVTVSNSMGCTGTDCFDVAVQPTPTFSIWGNHEICDDDTASLNVNMPFDSYSWSTGETTQQIFTTIPGQYCVTVSDGFGCTGEGCAWVFDGTVAPPTITGDTILCQGQTGQLEVPQIYYSYQWSNNTYSYVTQISQPGTYCVSVAWDDSNCSGVSCVEVVQLPNPSVEIIGDLQICPNSVHAIEATSGYASYFWENGETNVVRVISAPGEYCVTVTDNAGCQASACATVTELTPPQPVISGFAEICQDESQFLNAGGGYLEYVWSPGQASQIIEVFAPGTYCVTVTDDFGCSGEDCYTFGNFPAVEVEIFGSETLCDETSQMLDAGADYASYAWSNFASGQAVTISEGGEYCVTVTDGNGCAASDCLTVELLDLPQVSISGSAEMCQGASQILDAGADYAEYAWSNLAEGQTIEISEGGTYCVTVTDDAGCTNSNCLTVNEIQNTEPEILGETFMCPNTSQTLTLTETYASYLWSDGSTEASLDISGGGFYCVTVTDASGCTGSDCITVEVTPIFTFNLDDALICEVPGAVLYGPQASFIYSYLWSTGDTTMSIEVIDPGTYCLTVTDINGCTADDCAEVIGGAAIELELEPEVGLCQGQTVVLTASAVGMVDFLWSTGATGASITVGAPGNFCVTAINQDGCLDEACTEVFLLPNLTTVISDTLCAGEVIIGGGDTLTVPATYEIVLTSVFGCDSIVVYDFLAFPEMVIDSVTSEPVIGLEPGSATVWVSGGTPPYQYLWGTGDTTHTIVADEHGSYPVTVTDANGCEIMAVAEVELFDATNGQLADNQRFIVSPNPFDDSFTVLFSENTAAGRLQIFDSAGRLVHTEELGVGHLGGVRHLAQGELLEVHLPLASGVYFLKIETTDGEVIGWEKLVRR